MASLNLSQNGPSITASYQKVVNSTPSGPASSSPTYGLWALFSVKAPLANAFQAETGKESVLSVQTSGEGELVDLVDEFSDGRVQFAFVKVKDPNTALPKNVLIAWCGEGVPERTKGYFTSYLNAVAKVLHGYHVQVTARSDRDLNPDLIVQKVADASGAKYGGGAATSQATATSGPPPPLTSKPILPTKTLGAAGGFQALGSRTRAAGSGAPTDDDGWGQDAPPVTRSQLEKVAPAYQPTKVNIAELQKQHQPSQYQAPIRPSNSGADVVSGGYQPIGKIDIAAIRRQAQESGKIQDDRPTVVKGAYEPIGKVDIADIRRKAQGGPPPSAPEPAPHSAGNGEAEEDRPKSLAERSAAFSQSGRISELPKPKVANRFGSTTSAFTGTKAPAPATLGPKPIAAAAPVGVASRSFADQGGKTPAQLWAEKKARERGDSGAGDTQPAAAAAAAAISSQPSGGWQSGYAGKKWGVQIPSRTGGSGTGEAPEDEQHEETTADTGHEGIGSIQDRFAAASISEPPPLDASSKPNSSAVRGVPMPGLPTRPSAPSVPAEQHQDLPPPPPRPIPQGEEEEEEEEEDEPVRASSPVRIAMPVARSAEPQPLVPADSLPARPVPVASLAHAADEHGEAEHEAAVQDDEPARSAGQAAAISTFGKA